MENQKVKIVQSIKDASNVLVTVSSNPSVDQLSSAIGLTLILNKMGKHATAVFSGQIPSTIEFLEPDKTLEKNTDSLRDFIISLDKSKADKLRYKVEDTMVKIFITPYRTSIGQSDLDFSQGDFNVDAVIALGVKQREQLDEAIVTNGRILHDAVVISLNIDGSSELGTENWLDSSASSLSEMVMSLVSELNADAMLDSQIATAFLTGIVAETQRFSNEKTSSLTMTTSAKLMSAGANQQLIATKLNEHPKVQDKKADFDPQKLDDLASDKAESKKKDGSLQIDHEAKLDSHTENDDDKNNSDKPENVTIDEFGVLNDSAEENKHRNAAVSEQKLSEPTTSLLTSPPTLGGTLTANSRPENLDPSTDPLTLPPVNSPLLTHNNGDAELPPEQPKVEDILSATEKNEDPRLPTLVPAINNVSDLNIKSTDSPDNNVKTGDTTYHEEKQTLADLEKYVGSPHYTQTDTSPPEKQEAESEGLSSEIAPERVDAARDAVNQAVTSSPQNTLEPIAALNANPLGLNIDHKPDSEPVSPITADDLIDLADQPPELPQLSVDDNTGIPKFNLPSNLVPTSTPVDNTAGPSQIGSPPPVPPPMMPPGFGVSSNGEPDLGQKMPPPIL